ncbi:hypothetical protein BDN67DRAFT_976797 [Paxillus ammoniavirescens]|nr:hypothetical protein BDN67DRAFT_976797 [Paxillus ammoniavirescens]
MLQRRGIMVHGVVVILPHCWHGARLLPNFESEPEAGSTTYWSVRETNSMTATPPNTIRMSTILLAKEMPALKDLSSVSLVFAVMRLTFCALSKQATLTVSSERVQSSKISRKFGMVSIAVTSHLVSLFPLLYEFPLMSATGIVALFSILSAASSGANNSVTGMLAMLAACRFLISIGIGAGYPCGTVLTRNGQKKAPSPRMLSIGGWCLLQVYTVMDFGYVIGAFVPLVLQERSSPLRLSSFGDSHLRAVWRLSPSLGVVPALAVHDGAAELQGHHEICVNPTLARREALLKGPLCTFAFLSYNGGSETCILMYPFCIYPSAITNNVTGNNTCLIVVFGWSVVIKSPPSLFVCIVKLTHLAPVSSTYQDIDIAGTIGAFLVDHWGPKTTMIAGLLARAVTGFIVGGIYTQPTGNIAAFAGSYDQNYYGVAAAVGKIGAFIGTWSRALRLYANLSGDKTAKGNTGPFLVGSGLAILSALAVFILVRPLSYDGMKEEDAKFRLYLEEHGFDTSLMGVPDSEVSSTISEEEKAARTA